MAGDPKIRPTIGRQFVDVYSAFRPLGRERGLGRDAGTPRTGRVKLWHNHIIYIWFLFYIYITVLSQREADGNPDACGQRQN